MRDRRGLGRGCHPRQRPSRLDHTRGEFGLEARGWQGEFDWHGQMVSFRLDGRAARLRHPARMDGLRSMWGGPVALADEDDAP